MSEIKRGRRLNGRVVECPQCGSRIVVYPGEVKVCTRCLHKITKAEVRRLLKNLKNIK